MVAVDAVLRLARHVHPPVAGRDRAHVAIIPALPTAAYTPQNDRYCIHGATIQSKQDGQRHFVSARMVADLFGLRQGEWRQADWDYSAGRHKTDEYCLFPDYWGRYERRALPPLRGSAMTAPYIRRGVYQRKAIADRGVYIYRGEE